MVTVHCGPDTNHFWVVEQDGVRVARFAPADPFSAAWFASRLRASQ